MVDLNGSLDSAVAPDNDVAQYSNCWDRGEEGGAQPQSDVVANAGAAAEEGGAKPDQIYEEYAGAWDLPCQGSPQSNEYY